MTDQVVAIDGGPVTPQARRSSGASIITNPYRGDQGRYPAAPYLTYAETGNKSQNSSLEEIDNSCVIYVGGLTNRTDDRILYDTFRQFGVIVSLVRRSVNFDVRPDSTMTQYAFIGFSNARDAQNAIRTGEITLDNRKLVIKPRDKPGVSYHRQISHGHHNPQSFKGFEERYGDEGGEQILNMLHKNSRSEQPISQAPAQYEVQHQHMQQAHQTQREYKIQQMHKPEKHILPPTREPITYYDGSTGGPVGAKISNTGQSPVLMSKALNVANIPIDMPPKELFTMFAETGVVEGCYIFPFADHMNRRFGHIVMSSFFTAQKAVETYHGYTIRNCILDVTYRKEDSDTNQPSSPTTPYSVPYQQQPTQPTPPIQQSFPQHFPPNFPPSNFNPPLPPMYHPGFQAQHQQIAWLPSPYGSPPPGLVGPNGLIPFASQFPHYQSIVPFAAYNMGQMSPPGLESQHYSHSSPANSPPYQNFPHPSTQWQGPAQLPGKTYQSGKGIPRRQNGRMNGRGHFLVGRPTTHSQVGEPHIRSVSDSSSATLVSTGYDHGKFGGQVISSGSFIDSPVIANGSSYAGSFETPPRHSLSGDTSESDKDSTPSPIITRAAPDFKMMLETPTKVSPRATFEVLTAQIIPETSEPADPANLYIKNLDDAVISDSEDLKLLFVPYGPVASSFLSTYPGSGISRGYGFVAFVKPEDAATAKTKLNGTMVGKKRVFISYAERKEDRTQRLKDLFGGDKGEVKSKDKRDTDEIHEDSSDDTSSEIIQANGNAKYDKASDQSATDTPPSGELPKPEVSVQEAIVAYVEEAVEVSPQNIPPVISEQDITVATRWRGTQLTGIAEVVEEEELSRIGTLQDSSSLSTNVQYALPLIVHSPEYPTRDPKCVVDAIVRPPVTPEQQKFPVTSPNEALPDTSNNETIQNKNTNRFSRNGRQHHHYINKFPNRSSVDHGNSHDYNQQHHQGYYPNGNGSNGNRYYNKNTTGGYSGAKSMLPVPRNSNGVQTTPAPVPVPTPTLVAPTGPRIPYFNNATQQSFYPSYPNNEPLGQQHQGRKNARRNTGRGRVRDNNSSTHQAQISNGMTGKIEMAAAY